MSPEYVTLHLLINAVGNTTGESDRLDLRLGGEGFAAVGIESGVVDVRLLEVEGLRQLVRHQITDLAELLLLCRVPHAEADAVGLRQRLDLGKEIGDPAAVDFDEAAANI